MLVSLTFLVVGVININTFYSTFLFLLTTIYISISFLHLFFLYLTAIYVSRLLQILSPFLNERLKQFARKTHCAIFTEVVYHMLIPVIFVALTPFVYYVGVEIVFIVFVLLFSSCLIFASVF